MAIEAIDLHGSITVAGITEMVFRFNAGDLAIFRAGRIMAIDTFLQAELLGADTFA